MPSIQTVLIVVSVIIAIVFIVSIMRHLSRSKGGTGDDALYEAKTDQDYRRYIYSNTTTSAKPYIDQILGMVDDINRMVAQYNASYDQARYAAMNAIFNKANESEQFKVRDTFVIYKNRRDQEGRNIDELKSRQEASSSSRRVELGRQIRACCQTHKQISTLASQIGAINFSYLKRATDQNIETAKRRDYIATHFGERGRRWKERMRLRAGK